MERLSGLDAGFLYMETPTWHMHTLKIGLVDASSVPGGYRFERVQEELGRRLHLLPPFRRRIVGVPGSFHHPIWLDDPDFDMSRHIHRAVLPPSGTRRDLDDLIGRIASIPLDRDRPLWDLWVVEGLQDGTIAFIAKIHHAIADGIAASALLANVMSTNPDPSEPVGKPPRIRVGGIPPRWTLLVDAFFDHVRQLFRLPALIVNTARRLVGLVRHQRLSNVRTPRPVIDAPRTSFNAALSPNRSFATVSLPLEDFKVVRRAFAVTVNDVLLATVGRAVRAYLHNRGEYPDRSLVAAVPVSADPTVDVTRLMGNRVSNLFTTVASDLDDPAAQLAQIHRVTAEAKTVQDLLGAGMMADWVQYTPPAPYRWAIRQYSRLRGADRHRPPINLIVSNVAGPREPLYLAGAELTGLFSVGPVLEGVGLNVTAWSYLDQMNLSAISCPELIPDLHDLTDRLRPALDELVAAATSEPSHSVKPA